MIPLPKLYVNKKFNKILRPVSVSITGNIIPLSTASIILPEGEDIPVRSWMELFTPYGSAGMFRVRAPSGGYGNETSSVELEHMIAEVGDYTVKAEIDEMMAASTAVKTVFSHYKGGLWKLGKYSDIGTGKVAMEVKYDSILTVLLSILAQKPDCMMKFDFTTTPWTLNIVKRGTKVVSHGRLARNVNGAQVSYDESTMITRVWYQTWSEDEDGKVTGTWHHKDADTLKKYGIIERRLDTSFGMTSAEITQMVDTYIKEHRNPRTSVSIRAAELYRITKEKIDKFVIGDLFLLAIPKHSLSLELTITSITWADVYGDPDNVIVHLGNDEDTVFTFLHNLDATGAGISGGAGGGGSAGKSAKKNSLYDTQWYVYEDHIDGYSRRLDEHGKILAQAGLQLDPDQVLIYADNGTDMTLFSKFKVTNDAITTEVTNREKLEETLTGKINVEAGKISLVVEEKDGDNVIKSASIMTAINKDGSSIKLNADKIDLQGYVTMTAFSGLEGTVNTLAAGTFTGVGIRCGSFSCAAAQFTLGAHTVWKSTIKDGNGNDVNVMKWG